ncbi:MAG: SDR family NAD(P)-dependent oxidoreductase [Bifidobacteriaceae bacterium]|jgi:NAD(P)-dependent dehydrogenase (short-subunit alcohol dehydrogenase family)|nr:SDR family NAD(P)-dependent oxidoreductase [Bifidobacteriaceae bacterium]
MKKKIILVTGATDGIGKTTAMELAAAGNRVIVHGRSAEKAKAVVAEISQATGNEEVDYLLADLFSPDAIKNMATQFEKSFDHLDVLINNAGAVFDKERRETAEGIEITMALNVMAPFLLNELLLPSLRKSREGRIINMSSASHRASGKPDMNDLNFEHVDSAQRRYSLSKLFVIWNTQTRAHLLQERGIANVAVNASHPGTVATDFGQSSDKGFWTNLIYRSAISLAKIPPIGRAFSVEHGAATNIYLATSENVKGVSGRYFGNSTEQKPYAKYASDQNKQKLWDYCMSVAAPFLK